MDTLDEFTGSNDNHHSQIIKGKRTKRQRPSSPFDVVVTSSSSTGGGGGGGHGDRGERDVYSSIPSPTTSGDFSTSTEEEEDMANCLILLAQGGGPKQVQEKEVKIEKFTSQILTDMPPTTTTDGSDKAAGFYIYKCGTCNRIFSSFQALGGHRASHKKPKAMVEEKKALIPNSSSNNDIEDFLINTTNQVTNKGSNNNHNKPYKVHGCSVCGSEFSSGQALGGHMRRHRVVTNTQITTNIDTNSTIEESHEDEKPKHFLPLDLNLPAPEDDYHRDSKFQFRPNQQHLIFSGPALVDCYY